MTVAELIEKLRAFPQELPVHAVNNYGDDPVDDVHVEPARSTRDRCG